MHPAFVAELVYLPPAQRPAGVVDYRHGFLAQGCQVTRIKWRSLSGITKTRFDQFAYQQKIKPI
jgi:hypothetical protein